MKVIWDGHDAKAWDQDHGRLAGALQQDWAYGETMMALAWLVYGRGWSAMAKPWPWPSSSRAGWA